MSSGKRRALKPAKSDSCKPANVAKHTGYRPTDAEVAAAKEVLRKRNEQPALPAVKSDEGTKLVYDHPDQIAARCLAAMAIGCGDIRLSDGFIRQLADAATRDGKVHQSGMNFALAVVQGIDPKDTVEALLATQMAVVHSATMDAAANLAQAKYVEHRDSALLAVNKLARTFAAQVEALKKHRSAGEQTVRVEHVNVHEGGQAIVGIVKPQGVGVQEKSNANLMNRWDAMQLAPRCRATSKRTGQPCQAPAAYGKPVCRFHGARAGAPTGQANGAWRHGLRTNEAIAERRRLSSLIQDARAVLRQLAEPST